MATPKDKQEFGAGVILVKKSGGNFVALVFNAGIVDVSWSSLADNFGVRDKKWWVFKFPIGNVDVANRRSTISKTFSQGFGFIDEVSAVEKFDSLSDTKIGRITPRTMSDKEL